MRGNRLGHQALSVAIDDPRSRSHAAVVTLNLNVPGKTQAIAERPADVLVGDHD
jgi:hypothetical protein